MFPERVYTLEEMGFAAVHMVHNLRQAESVAGKADPPLDCALLDVNIAGEGLSLEFGRGLMAQGVHGASDQRGAVIGLDDLDTGGKRCA